MGHDERSTECSDNALAESGLSLTEEVTQCQLTSSDLLTVEESTSEDGAHGGRRRRKTWRIGPSRPPRTIEPGDSYPRYVLSYFVLRWLRTPFTFTWTPTRKDVLLRNCQQIPWSKVRCPRTSSSNPHSYEHRKKGHYKALEWREQTQSYMLDDNLGVHVEVEEGESGHSVVKTKGPSEGKFTFTSHDAGDHTICLSTNYTSWFSTTHIRLYLDIIVGTTRADTEHDRTHVSEVASKVRDLNQKLEDIRREQQYQRERESDYRDLSEATNTKAVWYSLAQIVVLIVTCAWQLRHLKNFFEDRKSR
ncbi:hypothetical protein D9757_004816 [Collybiopsis confluens]|uniref:GOLD domain-containing protein n=1 Tax=Collybiopsis confluens TaxID=2823264 RepID=A0A8H5HSK3_9AGAR|nr:hypothetical protein D9757_004816 [Collybiopsis confluens]